MTDSGHGDPAPREALCRKYGNLPLHDFAQNQIWLETVLLAADLLISTATLGLTEHGRGELRRLRLRLLHVAARIVRTGGQVLLRLPRTRVTRLRARPPTRTGKPTSTTPGPSHAHQQHSREQLSVAM